MSLLWMTIEPGETETRLAFGGGRRAVPAGPPARPLASPRALGQLRRRWWPGMADR